MEYLAPFLVAYGVYLYNYRKVISIKNQLLELKSSIMNENDKWILKKFDVVFEKMGHLEKRLTKLEARLGAYVAISVFISTAILKFADKLF